MTPPTPCKFVAIWDTGATASVITQEVVDACGLKPIGMTLVHGVHGSEQAETFLVNVHLPNGVVFPHVGVTKGRIAGAHVLIGMDIITAGDFSISNFGGRTVFTFRVPSLRTVDFVKEHNARMQQASAPRPKKKRQKKRRH